ncbi:MAG: hypothetical protein COT59_00075 [Candidatus Nealsonbacteria bacterium CG09_land_8_20_14_0_10_42_14]|uniref:Peptidase A24A-predicted C-terminal archaea domain-containing protein n=1 Tax=Candidatus Nealsonbacteria bacterium CG09_land_8_20_14_0_10_42_14 TaxID=1974707 RepID=A0A2H0WY29_9BACT|nr:MAG: hypothetical protein COT59_00075 [Candidatus Nealsonbacteria bacterium CG09_land_8_20_14_0_10_42_14]
MDPILIVLLIFGVGISYYDLKKGKIKNYSLLSLVLVSILINIFFTKAFLEFPLASFLNILSAVFIGVIVWLAGLWSAADAKLFMALNFLFPATFYRQSVDYFPGIAILINSAIPLFFFLFFQAMAKTNLQEKKQAFLNNFKLKFILQLLLTITAIFCLTFLISQFLPLRIGYPVWLTLIFLLFWVIEQKFKIDLKYFFAGLILLTITLSLIFNLPLFNPNSLLFISAFLLLIFFLFVLLTLSTSLFTHNVKIDKLEEGMVPAEMVVEEKGRFVKKPITFLTFLVLLRQRVKWQPLIGFNPDGLSKEEIVEIKSLREKKLLGFGELRISQTIPFALILFGGALLTYFLKGLLTI